MMGRQSGNVRSIAINSSKYKSLMKEIKTMQESGKYSSIAATMQGGYVAIEKGTFQHKAEEIEAAKILSRKGFKVILKDETGHIKTPDGYINKISFEQRTPKVGTEKGVNKNLEHAKKKGAEIAVIYDKYYIYHKIDIDNGIKLYEKLNKYRFKTIYVIAQNEKVYKHSHTK